MLKILAVLILAMNMAFAAKPVDGGRVTNLCLEPGACATEACKNSCACNKNCEGVVVPVPNKTEAVEAIIKKK